MEKTDAVAALAALAQDNRLDVYRLLVQAGPEGMPAGAVAEALDLAPNTLTFHFDRLRTRLRPASRRALNAQRSRSEHDPERWQPVFRKRSCSTEKSGVLHEASSRPC